MYGNNNYESDVFSYFETIKLNECDISTQILNNPNVVNKGSLPLQHPMISISHPQLQPVGLWYCMSDYNLNPDFEGGGGTACTGSKSSTCRPQLFNVIASLSHPREYRFQWNKGCTDIKNYQIKHSLPFSNYQTTVGGEFTAEAACDDEVSPETQLIHDNPQVLFDFGQEQKYCIEGVNPATKPVCNSFVTSWDGKVSGSVIPKGSEGEGVGGAWVTGYLCPASDNECKSANSLTIATETSDTYYYQHGLGKPLENANQLSFDVFSLSDQIVGPFRNIKEECPSEVTDFDFEIKLQRGMYKLVWSKRFPLCWRLLKSTECDFLDENSRYCYKYQSQKLNYDDARKKCNEIGGRLLSNSQKVLKEKCTGNIWSFDGNCVDCNGNKPSSCPDLNEFVCEKPLCDETKDGICYTYHDDKKSYDKAVETCNSFGVDGKLVEIKDIKTQKVLETMLHDKPCLNTWFSSELAEFENWYTDPAQDKCNFLSCNKNFNFKWFQSDCSSQKEFICSQTIRKENIREYNVVSSMARFKQEISGGNVFDRHFSVINLPDWGWMATSCRKTCGLCSKCANLAGDFACNQITQIDSSSCTPLKSWLPSPDFYFLDEEDKIDKSGSLINSQYTDCDPRKKEWAYFDPMDGWRCCLDKHPTRFSECRTYFLNCDHGSSRTAKPQAFKDKTTKTAIVSSSSSDLNDFGKSKFILNLPLLTSNRGDVDIQFEYKTSEKFQITNLWSGEFWRFSGTRYEDETGAYEMGFSSAERGGPTRNVRLFPSLSSELHHKDHTSSLPHLFVSLFDAENENDIGLGAHTEGFRKINLGNENNNFTIPIHEKLYTIVVQKDDKVNFGYLNPNSVFEIQGAIEDGGHRIYENIDNSIVTGTHTSLSDWFIGPAEYAKSTFITAINNVQMSDRFGNTLPAATPFEIVDSTMISITVRVSYANVREYFSCGVNGIQVCAYYTQGVKAGQVIHDSCTATDESGTAKVRVSQGSKILIDYACHLENADGCTSDGSEKKEKIGRKILPVDENKNILSSPRILDTNDASLDLIVDFVDYSFHELDIIAGAGPFHYGWDTTKKNYLHYSEVEKNHQDPNLENLLRENDPNFYAIFDPDLQFELLHKTRRECDITRMFGAKRNSPVPSFGNGKWFPFNLPHDIPGDYEVTISSPKFEKVSQFFVDLKYTPIRMKQNENKFYAVFSYRREAQLELKLENSTADIFPDGNCEDQYFVPQSLVNGDPNEVAIELQAIENYTSVVDSDEDVLVKIMQGNVQFVDDLAHGEGSRHTSLKVDEQSKPVFGVEGCGLTGCKAPFLSKQNNDPDPTSYFKILRLGYPQLTQPFYKLLRAYFKSTPAFPNEPIIEGSEIVKVVILGIVPFRMHQTIKMPEYIPFLILRKPPGDSSSASWSKNSQYSVSLDVKDSYGMKIGGFWKNKFIFGAAVDSGINIPWIGKVLNIKGKGQGGLEGKGTIGIKPYTSVISKGNTITLSSNMFISTTSAAGWAGMSGDLFVVPTLTIKVVESFSVSKNENDCGMNINTISQWLALDGGSQKDLNDLIAQNFDAINPVAADAQKRLSNCGNDDKCKQKEMVLIEAAQLKNVTKTDAASILSHVQEDEHWNSVTVHSMYHIYQIRIPQLQRQCREIYKVINDCATKNEYLDYFETAHVKLESPPESKVCGDIPNGSPMNCNDWLIQNKVTKQKKFEGSLHTRLELVQKGIHGWRKTLWFNEHLKDGAKDNGFRMSELIGSPLDIEASSIPGDLSNENILSRDGSYYGKKAKEAAEAASEQHIGSKGGKSEGGIIASGAVTGGVVAGVGAGATLVGAVNGAVAALSGVSATKGDGIVALGMLGFGAGVANGVLSSSLAASHTNSFESKKTQNKVQNLNSVIGFAGGGASYKFSWSASRSQAMSLSLDGEFEAKLDIGIDMEGKAESGAGFHKSGEAGLDWSHTFGWSDGESYSSGMDQTMSFELKDSNRDDLFDVKIMKDPVYGTPVFKTLGGRSNCPHEPGTDNNDQFELSFTNIDKQFDDVDEKSNGKYAVVVAASDKTCASINLDVKTHPPGGLEQFSRTIAVVQENKNSPMLNGISVRTGGKLGTVTSFNPVAGDTTVQRMQMKFCISDEDAIKQPTAYNDGSEGEPGVFKNLEIVLRSDCEYSMKPSKYSRKELAASTPKCDDEGFPIGKRNDCAIEHSYDVEIDSPNGGDPTRETFTFVEEPYLRSRIKIMCLSFVGDDPCKDALARLEEEYEGSSESKVEMGIGIAAAAVALFLIAAIGTVIYRRRKKSKQESKEFINPQFAKVDV